MYIQEALNAHNPPINTQVYWRKRTHWGESEAWQSTPYPDGKEFWDIDDYEYIAYSPSHIYIWVIYDCYTASFHMLPLSQSLLTKDVHCVEAG